MGGLFSGTAKKQLDGGEFERTISYLKAVL
jgi:hypothetical protein